MNDRIKHKIETFLSKEYACSLSQLNGTETVYSVKTDALKPYIKILAYRNCVLICTSKSLSRQIRELLQGKSRDEIFELPFVYGQTIHYVPDMRSADKLDLPSQYDCEFLMGAEIQRLAGLTGFENSLAFDENGRTPTKAVCLAKDKGRIIGLAGSAETPVKELQEIGIDVIKEYRTSGLGTYLVSKLTDELLLRSIVPFYSASVTNIGSQMVAARCNYIPAWVDTFGTTLDGSSVYKENIHLDTGSIIVPV